VCEVPRTLHMMLHLHLEESGNKEQRKAGGFNYRYNILDELPGLQRTKQTGNFVAAFFSSAADDSRWPADSPG
jgi:hypothetical protein